MVLAARLREALGLPGMTVAQTLPFRDKEAMKQLRWTPPASARRATRAHSTVAGIWAAAERIGYPLIVKPIAGAGSADTYRCDSRPKPRERAARPAATCPSVSVEEFVEAEEFTFDTVCAGGEILFENVCWYRPRPLQSQDARVDQPGDRRAARPRRSTSCRVGIEMGHDVIRALGLPRRLHPHGVVPQGRRRGRVRRDRRPPAGGAHRRRHELRDGRRPLRRTGRKPWSTAGRASPMTKHVQRASIFKRAHGSGRITHSRASTACWPRSATACRGRGSPADRRAAARLARDAHLRRHAHRAPSRAAGDPRRRQPVRPGAAPARGLIGEGGRPPAPYRPGMTTRRAPRWSELKPLLGIQAPAFGREARVARAANIRDLRSLALRRAPRAVFDYTDGAAEDETSLRRRAAGVRGGRVPAPRAARRGRGRPDHRGAGQAVGAARWSWRPRASRA